MPELLTLLADSRDGKHFEITLEHTEADNGVLRLESWGSNLDHRRDEPSRDEFLKLYDIRFDGVQRLTCKAKMNGSYPTITFMFATSQDGKPATIRAVIADTFAGQGDGTLDYTLGSIDYEKVMHFLSEADFPMIEASVIKNEKAVLRR